MSDKFQKIDHDATSPPPHKRLLDIESLSRLELIELARTIPWYHTIDFGDFVSEGEFEDFSPLLTAFGFPQDMRDMTVIDVGRASGFFAFELERRGALVTATELPDPHGGKDYVGGASGRQVVLDRWRNVIASMGGERLDYTIAHRLFESKVRSLRCSAYDLCPELTQGKIYDLAFYGSVLNHLANPMSALIAARSITKRIVICCPYEPERDQTDPVARLVGYDEAKGLTTWWLPTLSCMHAMLFAAGFSEVRTVTENMPLKQRDSFVHPHFVVHAAVLPTSNV